MTERELVKIWRGKDMPYGHPTLGLALKTIKESAPKKANK